MSDSNKPSAIPPPPSGLPPPTGNVSTDVYNSITHVLEVPCAKNAFLQGILGAVGVGFIRGTTAKPIVAGHWAISTFVGVSTLSWYLCQSRIQRDRARVTEMLDRTHKAKKVKYVDDDGHGSA